MDSRGMSLKSAKLFVTKMEWLRVAPVAIIRSKSCLHAQSHRAILQP
jgi:hypothetical protein